jgi:hypothetical protein
LCLSLALIGCHRSLARFHLLIEDDQSTFASNWPTNSRTERLGAMDIDPLSRIAIRMIPQCSLPQMIPASQNTRLAQRFGRGVLPTH